MPLRYTRGGDLSQAPSDSTPLTPAAGGSGVYLTVDPTTGTPTYYDQQGNPVPAAQGNVVFTKNGPVDRTTGQSLTLTQNAQGQPTVTSAPTYSSASDMMNALLAQGIDPNTAVNRVNQQFNLPYGQSYAYYAPGSKGSGSGAYIGVPGGGYLAQGPNGGAWNYNAGDSGGGGGSASAANPTSAAGYGNTQLPAPNGPVNYEFSTSPLQQWTIPFEFPAFNAPTSVTEQNDPGYQFRMQQAQQAEQRAATAGGNSNGAGADRALQDYIQGVASNEYGNVYNRALQDWTTNYNQALQGYQTAYNVFSNNQANQYNRLANLAGLGQTAATNLNTTGLGYAGTNAQTSLGLGNTLANLYGSQGSALAAGQVGSANAYGGMLGNYGNYAMMYPYIQSAYHFYNQGNQG